MKLKAVWCVKWCVVLACLVTVAQAGPREQVDAANALVWARQHFRPKPKPDDFGNPNLAVPESQTEPEVVEARVQPEPVVPAPSESEKLLGVAAKLMERQNELCNSIGHALVELGLAKAEIQEVRDEIKTNSASPPSDPPLKELLPDSPTPAEVEADKPVKAAMLPVRKAMWIDFEPIKAGMPTAKREVFLFTGEDVYGTGWCINCPAAKRKFGNGVTVSTAAAPGEQTYPALRWRVPDGSWRFPAAADGTYRVPDSLEELNAIVERSFGGRQSVQANGSAGAIHAKNQIETAIQFWKERIGVTQPDGTPVKVQMVWRRTGGQTFALIHAQPGQWNVQNIFGSLGEFEFSAPGSRLPVELIILGYRRSNKQLLLRGEVSIDETKLGLPGDVGAKSFGEVAFQTGLPQATPNGIDPLTLWTVFSIVRDVVSLLHPTCDLTLGGQVSATAWYDEQRNAIQIDVSEMPVVKLTWLFHFDLGVRQLVISPDNVHVEFAGSAIVKSRDFSVR